MSTSLGRFRILGENELLPPGNCVICGSTSGQFVDFGFEQDFYGVIYFCFDSCFKEAANAFEYVTPAQHRVCLDQINFLRDENNQLKDQIEEMRRVFGNLVDNIGVSSDFGSGLVVVDEGTKLLYKEPESTNTAVEGTESGVTKQNNESRLADIQYDASIDEIESAIDI